MDIADTLAGAPVSGQFPERCQGNTVKRADKRIEKQGKAREASFLPQINTLEKDAHTCPCVIDQVK